MAEKAGINGRRVKINEGVWSAVNGNQSSTGFPFNGLTGQEWNPNDAGNKVTVYKIQATDDHPYLMPGVDPGEGFQNTNNQLFSTTNPKADAKADNMGFVKNFKAAIASDTAKHYSDTLPGTTASEIMAMYSPELLPIISGLAKGYAVCDAWFASVPTQTIPNRAFAGAGTSRGTWIIT